MESVILLVVLFAIGFFAFRRVRGLFDDFNRKK